ncbi:serine hydrolase domain-containing protein [Flagellimonas iocasae]|uniref:Serine hydrolase domain-containing protein n=1 Tax=Flagellimonas iocasae TaxID=2055905 RepID=A0ABW4XW39_9FLAO
MSALLAHIKHLFSGTPRVKSEEGLTDTQKADAIFHNLVAEGQVPGLSVTILKKGEIILQKGYGYADVEQKILVDPKRTIFRIASISKCITGLALGKMMEDGIVDVDASFYQYVPDYPKKRYDFTLRQLASHTAGIRGYRGKEYALNQNFSIKDSTAIFKNDPLLFQPGEGYFYNSFDFVLLSLAMQEASGMPFEDYVAANVFDALEMNRTTSPSVSSTTVENSAQFYTKRSMCFKKALPVNNFYKIAGGGFLSTSDDVARLGQAILEQKLLKKETYDQLLSSQTVAGSTTFYGLGFQVSQDAKGRSFVGHVGSSVGAYTNFFVYPEAKVMVSILINCTDPKVQQRLDEAIDAVLHL